MDRNTLFDTIRNGDIKQLRDLLDQGDININQLDENEFTPLMFAISIGGLKEASILLDYGADPNIHPKSVSPLLFSVGTYMNIEKLLSLGADPNFRDLSGDTPLSEAFRYKDTRATKLLILYGAILL